MCETQSYDHIFAATQQDLNCLVRCSLVHVEVESQLLLHVPLLNFEGMGTANSQLLEAGAKAGRLCVVEVRFHFQPTPYWSV